jgi:hypothetical protein
MIIIRPTSYHPVRACEVGTYFKTSIYWAGDVALLQFYLRVPRLFVANYQSAIAPYTFITAQ